MALSRLRFWGLCAAVLTAAACTNVFTVPLDVESKEFYDTARLIMTNAEDEIFRRLPDSGARNEFIEDFWEKRDPDPETPENEFRQEFMRRVEYTNQHFKEGKRGVNTDRGRIYLFLGPPEKTESYSSANEGYTLLWIYYTYDVAVVFTETRVGGEYKIANVTGNLFEAIETAKLNGFGRVQKPSAGLAGFSASYDGERKMLVVSIPVKKLNLREESGVFKADFGFTIYFYKPSLGQKDKFEERRSFEGPVADVEKTEALTFTFAYDLLPGKSYVDIIINGGTENGRVRKILTFKIT